MNVRKRRPNGEYTYGTSSKFTSSISGEISVYTAEDAESWLIKETEVEMPGEGWFNMGYAFVSRMIVPDNYSLEFGIPRNTDERAQGFNW